jgi:hypothetical protein
VERAARLAADLEVARAVQVRDAEDAARLRARCEYLEALTSRNNAFESGHLEDLHKEIEDLQHQREGANKLVQQEHKDLEVAQQRIHDLEDQLQRPVPVPEVHVDVHEDHKVVLETPTTVIRTPRLQPAVQLLPPVTIPYPGERLPIVPGSFVGSPGLVTYIR